MNSLDNYSSVWVIDTGFQGPDGEPHEPVCLCAHELRSGRRLELFFDEPHENPFDYTDALFVAYNASVEFKTFISLGWSLPEAVLDLQFEYLRVINGLWLGHQSLKLMGRGLADAMEAFGLDAFSHAEKDAERDSILSNRSYPPEGQRRILDHCWTGVDGTMALLGVMLTEIDFDQALLRGSYSKAVAWMEHNGLPLSALYEEVQEHRAALSVQIARSVEEEHQYGVYAIEGERDPQPVFKRRGLDALIERSGLVEVWPITAAGQFSTSDEDAFKPMSRLHPELRPLRQARKSIKALALFGSNVGHDRRNRAGVLPFGTSTGRNNPNGSQFILSRPHWVRNLIAPGPGRCLVHADIVAAEVGIAADASGDPELIRVYNSGLDPYIEFAIGSGALPIGTVRDKGNNPDVEEVRSLYKVADLAIKYGMGGANLALNLGIPTWQAERIIGTHKRVYRTYWAWAQAQIEQAYQTGYISTSFGWTMSIDRSTKRNSVLNFPQQATCSELLRLTCVLLVERGFGPMLCATHHDAFYLECEAGQSEDVGDALRLCFDEAVGIVLSGRVGLRLEIGIVHYPDHYQDEDGQEIWHIVTEYLQCVRTLASRFS